MEYTSDLVYSNEFLMAHFDETIEPEQDKNNIRIFRNAVLLSFVYGYPLGGEYLRSQRQDGMLQDDYSTDTSKSYRYNYLQFRKKYMAQLKQYYDKWLAKKNKKNESKLYLVTFTLDPVKVPELTEDIKVDIENYISSLKSRDYIAEPDKYVFRYEVPDGNDTHHHWHVGMYTKKKIDKTRFQYYTTNYGNVDLSLSKTGEYKINKLYVTKGDPEKLGNFEKAVLDKITI